MTDAKTNLLGMTRQQLASFFAELGEKSFRASQVMKWMHHFGEDDFDAMTDISKTLRQKLKSVATIKGPEVVSCDRAADGTRKWVVRVASGSCVETVFIPEDKRGTLCVSSQAGCALDCSFCSTGKQGFNSDLTCAEIVGQVWLARKTLGSAAVGSHHRPVTNVVMMGMGEPLLNFDNVMNAMDVMMDDYGYGLSKRRVTLSTSGIVPAMYKMVGRTDVSLAVSLHAGNDELRDQLVPVNKKFNLHKLLAAIDAYMKSLPDKHRVVTIEYTLLAGINDQLHHARQVGQLLRDVPCKINLIPFNPFPGSGYVRPSNNAIRRFQAVLAEAGFNTTVRRTRGDEIDAACGQLVGAVQDRTRRSAQYRTAQKQQAEQAIRLVEAAQ